MILMEPMLWDNRVKPLFIALEKQVVKVNKTKKEHWEDVDAAMRHLQKLSPWKSWDPRVLELLRVCLL